MDVNVNVSVSTVGASATSTYNTAAEEKTDTVTTNVTVVAEDENQNEAAVYESSEKSGGAKKNYKPDVNKLKEMMADSERQVQSFRKLIEGLFNKQAKKADDAFGWLTGKGQNTEQMIEIDDETRAAAQKELEEGGYYSVEETAKRILDFAVAISGGDPAKISTLKDAVKAGFGAAGEEWGSKLPEISQKTYDAVMQGFDEWEKAGSSDAITLLNKTEA